MFWVFIAAADISAESVTIAGPAGHHLARVLRVRPGERGVAVSDGRQYAVEVTDARAGRVVARILDQGPAAGEPPVWLTVLQAVLPNPDFDAVIEGGTAVGVSRFIAIQAARSQSHPAASRATRWQAVAQSAAEQSHRGIVPAVLGPLPLRKALETVRGDRLLVLDPRAPTPLRSNAGDSVSIAIGPEGGWRDDEVQLMQDHGGTAVNLGPRILRARLAPIVATAILVQQS